MNKSGVMRFQPFWHPFGHGAVVAVAPQALALVDAVGACILEAMAQGSDRAAIASSLSATGVLDDAQAGQACDDIARLMQARDVASPPATATAPLPPASATRQLILQLFATRIGFAFADDTTAQLILALWPVAGEATTDAAHADLHITVHPVDGGWLLSTDGQLAGQAGNTAELKSLLVREVLCGLHGTRSWAMVLHASAILAGDRLLLLPGRSGSGKTTLAAALCDRGASLFSDDCVPLRADTLTACAAPGSLGIRPAARDGLNATHMTVAGLSGVPGDLRHHTWAPRHTDRREAPVAALVFPVHDANGPDALEPLSPEARLSWLLASGSGIETLTPAGLAALLNWLEATPAWVIRYGHTATALGYIDHILATDL